MITVTIRLDNQQPIEENIPFQLVSPGGKVLSSAKTEAAGIVTFDIDPENFSQAAIRLNVEEMEKLKK